jgi:hypothetical protein
VSAQHSPLNFVWFAGLAFNVFFWASIDGHSAVFGLAVVLLFGGVIVAGVRWSWPAGSSCWSPGGCC